MDLRQLKYCEAVAKHESLSAASEVQNVTHPAIGQQIRKLEDGQGLKLLKRHSLFLPPGVAAKVTSELSNAEAKVRINAQDHAWPGTCAFGGMASRRIGTCDGNCAARDTRR